MNFGQLYQQSRWPVSFELFPPKEGQAIPALMQTVAELAALQPAILTVTYGALGSTLRLTQQLVTDIQQRFSLPVASHLTCVAATRASVGKYLEILLGHGIRHIVALRGDRPVGQNPDPAPGEFRHAADLVAFIKAGWPQLSIAVAGYPEKHPEAADFSTDIRHLRAKVDAGADAVLTQLFYDNDDFFRFHEACLKAGIAVPIVPGLMPIQNFKQILRITALCGARIPEALRLQLDRHQEDAHAIADIGAEWTIRQITGLRAHGFGAHHLYVLNRAQAAQRIIKELFS